MEKLLALKSERAELIKESKEAYDKFLESKEVTDKEAYKAIEEKISEIEENIAEIERINEREASLIGKEIIDTKNKETKKVMENKDNVKLFESFLRGQKLDEANAVVDTNGNGIMPTELEQKIIEGRKKQSIMRRYASVRTSKSDKVIPVATSVGASGWRGDGGLSSDNLTVGSVSMAPYEVGREIIATSVQMQDEAVNLAEFITDACLYTNTVAMEQAFWTGNGTAKPTGVVSGATEVLTATASTRTLADYETLINTVPEQYRPFSKFYMTDAERVALKALVKAADASFDTSKPFTHLWEYEIVAIPYLASTVADGNVMALFGDLSYYRIEDRENILVKVLEEKNSPDTTFQVIERTDGKLLVAEAVAKLVVASA